MDQKRPRIRGISGENIRGERELASKSDWGEQQQSRTEQPGFQTDVALRHIEAGQIVYGSEIKRIAKSGGVVPHHDATDEKERHDCRKTGLNRVS